MFDYLPDIYMRVRNEYPGVAAALDALGAATESAGPIDQRSQRPIKVGIAVGALADGADRSNARKALKAGVTAEEVRQVSLLAITTRGFPAAVAALACMDDVLQAERPGT